MKKSLIALVLGIFPLVTFANPLDFKVSLYKYENFPAKVRQICKKDKNNCPIVEIDIVKTNYPWLNLILNDDEKNKWPEVIANFVDIIEANPQARNDFRWIRHVNFVGKSANLLEFLTTNDINMGVPQSFPTQFYTLVDLRTKKEVTLDDLVMNASAKKILEKRVYQEYLKVVESKVSAQEKAKYKQYMKDWSFELTESFYFDQNNLIFSYDSYEIGPYASGVVELKINKKELQQIVKPKYLNEKMEMNTIKK